MSVTLSGPKDQRIRLSSSPSTLYARMYPSARDVAYTMVSSAFTTGLESTVASDDEGEEKVQSALKCLSTSDPARNELDVVPLSV